MNCNWIVIEFVALGDIDPKSQISERNKIQRIFFQIFINQAKIDNQCISFIAYIPNKKFNICCRLIYAKEGYFCAFLCKEKTIFNAFQSVLSQDYSSFENICWDCNILSTEPLFFIRIQILEVRFCQNLRNIKSRNEIVLHFLSQFRPEQATPGRIR